MLRHDLSARVAELRAERRPFVHARVVLAERPTSAKPGDEAIVLADGTVEGFVGGTCAEATVRQQALATLASGETLVVRITATPEAAPGHGCSGRIVVHNPCLSGGTLEVFLEPDVPEPMVMVVGRAPTAEAVLSLGRRLGYEARSYAGDVPADTAAVVVASHGRGEEAALTAALEAGVPYVGLVASARRGRAVVDSLDLPAALRARVRTPAGLDIGARTPEEVALSILAEIIASRPRRGRPAGEGADRSAEGVVDEGPRPAGAGFDPVCGMAVAVGAGAPHVEHAGRTVWFCGRGCLQAFRADPALYPA